MSTFTNPLTSLLCDIDLYNELQSSFNEFKSILDQSRDALFSAGDHWQKKSMWYNWQYWLEYYCTRFLDPTQPIKADGSLNYYTVASWREKAGIPSDGFTRKYKGVGGVATGYGLCEVDDYIGPHLFLELQRGLAALATYDPDDPEHPYTIRPSGVDIDPPIITSAGETWSEYYPPDGMGDEEAYMEYAKTQVDGWVTAGWPFGSYIHAGAYTKAQGSLTGFYQNPHWEAGVGSSRFKFSATISEKQATESLCISLWVDVVRTGGDFNAFGLDFTEGQYQLEIVTPAQQEDDSWKVESQEYGNVDAILGGDGVSWGTTRKWESGSNKYAEASMGYRVANAYFLIKWPVTYV